MGRSLFIRGGSGPVAYRRKRGSGPITSIAVCWWEPYQRAVTWSTKWAPGVGQAGYCATRWHVGGPPYCLRAKASFVGEPHRYLEIHSDPWAPPVNVIQGSGV